MYLNIDKEEFSKMELLRISHDSMYRIHYELSPLFNIIESNLKENNILCELRDYLLPKLMSGEIDVSNLPLPS